MNLMALVHLEPRHKRDSMVSGNNRGQKGYLLASPQFGIGKLLLLLNKIIIHNCM